MSPTECWDTHDDTAPGNDQLTMTGTTTNDGISQTAADTTTALNTPSGPQITRSGRVSQPPARLIETM